MNIAHPQRPLQPAITFSSVLHIWSYIWKAMETTRLSQPNLVVCPRLSNVEINVGSFRASHSYSSLQDWEQCEQIKFRVRRSERDHEASAGLVTVSCLELDELKAKQGTGPVTDQLQERLVQEVEERADDGLSWKRDTRLDRQGSFSLVENNFKIVLSMQNLVPFLFEEEEWTPTSNEGGSSLQ